MVPGDKKSKLCAAGWTLAAGLWLPVTAAAQHGVGAGLAELSLQQLSDLPVTSVSGRPESLRSAPASVFVISGEDIRRAGATSLPEALQLAPNLQVARLNASQYAISARGMNTAIANKLLVLIDGRTIYSNLFAGVFWDAHDLVLEDIDRIEVISGPGGTLWGANAVNGVINVITRSAAQTQGTLLTATRSRSDGGGESVRWGGQFGDRHHLRLYALGRDRNNSELEDGAEKPDASSKQQVGFRLDHAFGDAHLTFQGDAYRAGHDPGSFAAPKMYGGNLLARWESRFAGGGPYRVQAYYDLQARKDPVVFQNRAANVDLQFTHEPVLASGHQLLWGAGHRVGNDRNELTQLVRFIPADRRLAWSHVFVQHEWRLDQWQLTTGLKAERNSYTGIEWLPSARVAYQHTNQASTWAALSRTVRAPARIDRELFFPANEPTVAGGAGFESETAHVIEVGHRGRLGPQLSFSATLFRHEFEKLRALRGMPAVVANRIDGHVAGIEAWSQWQPAPYARFTFGYTGLRKSFEVADPPANANAIANLGNDPRSQWKLRGQFDLPRRTELDLHLRHVGALPEPGVPSYTVVDARLGWQATPGVELSLVARNLLNRRHAEFEPAGVASYFGRRFFLRVAVQL